MKWQQQSQTRVPRVGGFENDHPHHAVQEGSVANYKKEYQPWVPHVGRVYYRVPGVCAKGCHYGERFHSMTEFQLGDQCVLVVALPQDELR